MQEGTGYPTGAVCAKVRSASQVEVVIHCDRCPAHVIADDAGRREASQRWTVAKVQTGVCGAAKELKLCGDCTRSFRLFMLGCGVDAVRIERIWESLVSEAV